MDNEGRVFLVVTDKNYPARVAYQAVDDFKAEVRG